MFRSDTMTTFVPTSPVPLNRGSMIPDWQLVARVKDFHEMSRKVSSLNAWDSINTWSFVGHTTQRWMDLTITAGWFVPKIWEQAMEKREVLPFRIEDLKKENRRWMKLTVMAAGPSRVCSYLEGEWARCFPSSPPMTPDDIDRYQFFLTDGERSVVATFHNSNPALVYELYIALLEEQLHYGASYFAMDRLAERYLQGEISGLDPAKHGDLEWYDVRRPQEQKKKRPGLPIQASH